MHLYRGLHVFYLLIAAAEGTLGLIRYFSLIEILDSGLNGSQIHAGFAFDCALAILIGLFV
jgi:hypothetical protein